MVMVQSQGRESPRADAAERPELPLNVVLLTNIISPHLQPVYAELARHVSRLTILVSTPMEPNRPAHWRPDWGPLDVRVQRTTTFVRQWHHPAGFTEPIFVHVPWDTISLLRRLRPDVVISSELGLRTAFSSIYKLTSHRPPLVLWAALSEHTEQGRSWLRRRLRKFLVRQADGLIVNGASGERYIRGLGFRGPRAFHIPYAALPGTFDRGPALRGMAEAHRLLYVGRLSELKCVLPFSRALIQWAQAHPQRQIEFLLAGDGPIRPHLEALQTPPNLAIRLLGTVDYRQIVDCYAQSGILVFPSLSDEWGLVVNEAMAAGLPVLGSRYSQAVEELCEDGRTGWTFRPNVGGEMERALDRALATPVDELNRMRLAARRRVADLRPENQARRVVDAIRAVWEASGRAAASRESTPGSQSPVSRHPRSRRCWATHGSTKHLAMRVVGRVGVGLDWCFGSLAGAAPGILTYHRVGTPPSDLAQPPDCVTADQFHEQIAGLLARGFRAWPLGQLIRASRDGRAIPAKTFAITIDDGYTGVYTQAFPVLRRLQVPATLFPCTAYLDSSEPFPFDTWAIACRERMGEDLYRPLTTAQCEDMLRSKLIELGAHTHTHADFRGRSEEFHSDLRTSQEILRSRFGLEEMPFAFPFGHSHLGYADEPLMAAVRRAGLTCALTTDPRPAAPASDPFGWGRFTAFSWDTSATLAAKLDGWYGWASDLYRAAFRLVHGNRR